MKQTTINEGIFIGIKISMREGKVMATGSKRGSSADAALRWKQVMQAVGFTGYVTKQTFVSSKCQVINVEECVTQAAFESFTEEGINPRFVTLGN